MPERIDHSLGVIDHYRWQCPVFRQTVTTCVGWKTGGLDLGKSCFWFTTVTNNLPKWSKMEVDKIKCKPKTSLTYRMRPVQVTYVLFLKCVLCTVVCCCLLLLVKRKPLTYFQNSHTESYAVHVSAWGGSALDDFFILKWISKKI